MPSNIEGIQDTGSLGEGEGEPTGSLSAIEAYMDAQVALIANFHETLNDMPAAATPRENGHFSNEWDLQEWLEEGALLAFDENGAPAPLPWVHVLKVVDADTGDVEYIVYICETSDCL